MSQAELIQGLNQDLAADEPGHAREIRRILTGL